MLKVANEEYELNKDGFDFEPFNAVLELSEKVFEGEVLDLNSIKSFDVGDNGVYIVDNKFKIVGREDFSGEEQDSHNPKRMEIFITRNDHLGSMKTETIMEKIDKYNKE